MSYKQLKERLEGLEESLGSLQDCTSRTIEGHAHAADDLKELTAKAMSLEETLLAFKRTTHDKLGSFAPLSALHGLQQSNAEAIEKSRNASKLCDDQRRMAVAAREAADSAAGRAATAEAACNRMEDAMRAHQQDVERALEIVQDASRTAHGASTEAQTSHAIAEQAMGQAERAVDRVTATQEKLARAEERIAALEAELNRDRSERGAMVDRAVQLAVQSALQPHQARLDEVERAVRATDRKQTENERTQTRASEQLSTLVRAAEERTNGMREELFGLVQQQQEAHDRLEKSTNDDTSQLGARCDRLEKACEGIGFIAEDAKALAERGLDQEEAAVAAAVKAVDRLVGPRMDDLSKTWTARMDGKIRQLHRDLKQEYMSAIDDAEERTRASQAAASRARSRSPVRFEPPPAPPAPAAPAGPDYGPQIDQLERDLRSLSSAQSAALSKVQEWASGRLQDTNTRVSDELLELRTALQDVQNRWPKELHEVRAAAQDVRSIAQGAHDQVRRLGADLLSQGRQLSDLQSDMERSLRLAQEAKDEAADAVGGSGQVQQQQGHLEEQMRVKWTAHTKALQEHVADVRRMCEAALSSGLESAENRLQERLVAALAEWDTSLQKRLRAKDAARTHLEGQMTEQLAHLKALSAEVKVLLRQRAEAQAKAAAVPPQPAPEPKKLCRTGGTQTDIPTPPCPSAPRSPEPEPVPHQAPRVLFATARRHEVHSPDRPAVFRGRGTGDQVRGRSRSRGRSATPTSPVRSTSAVGVGIAGDDVTEAELWAAMQQRAAEKRHANDRRSADDALLAHTFESMRQSVSDMQRPRVRYEDGALLSDDDEEGGFDGHGPERDSRVLTRPSLARQMPAAAAAASARSPGRSSSNRPPPSATGHRPGCSHGGRGSAVRTGAEGGEGEGKAPCKRCVKRQTVAGKSQTRRSGQSKQGGGGVRSRSVGGSRQAAGEDQTMRFKVRGSIEV